MCNEDFNERFAPLNRRHLAEVQEQFPQQETFARSVFNILTRDLTPQVNLLVAFVILKELYDRGRAGIFGKFGRVLYAPLSIVAKTGAHEWTRFRPKPVEELHSSFLSFMMAKPNKIALEYELKGYGIMLSQRHCCGILFGSPKDVIAFEQSEDARLRNIMRSYAESMGMPVVVADFDDIPAENSDLGPVEREFYERYEQVFGHMTPQGRSVYHDPTQDTIWDTIIASSSNMSTCTSVA